MRRLMLIRSILSLGSSAWGHPVGVAVMVVTATSGFAAEAGLTTTRPPPHDVPTSVSIGLYVIDVAKIDDAAQTFEADVFYTAKWRDESLRLPTDSGDRLLSLWDVWQPAVMAVNRRDMKGRTPDLVRVSADGDVTFELRGVVTLASPLDLRDFPFDVQQLEIDLASVRYGPDEVELALDRDTTGRMERFTVAGWDVDLGEVQISHIDRERGGQLVRFTQRLVARRQSSFFVMKVVVPLCLIVFMAWTVFWVDPGDIGPQFGIATASVLTMIAFQFSLVRMLPHVSYLTRLDRFLLGATVLVFLALGEATLSSRMARGGRIEAARRLDVWSRWIYVALFAALVTFSLLV
jgi:hypothetical protein